MLKLDIQYTNLLQSLSSTNSIFGTQIKHKMSDGFPLLSIKENLLELTSTELKWIIKGDNNIKYLVDNNNDLYNELAYTTYLRDLKEITSNPDSATVKDFDYLFKDHPLSKEEYIQKIKEDNNLSPDFKFSQVWGNIGPIYGPQWTKRGENQLKNLVEDLKSSNPPRPFIINSWNIFELGLMAIFPRHYSFQCSKKDGQLSLMWNQREVNAIGELPYITALYGFLLLILCKETNLEPGELVGNLGDVFINQEEKIENIINQLPTNFPKVSINNLNISKYIFDYSIE